MLANFRSTFAPSTGKNMSYLNLILYDLQNGLLELVKGAIGPSSEPLRVIP